MSGWSRRDMILAGSLAINLVLAGFVMGAGARVLGGGGFHGGLAPGEPGAGLMHPRAVIAALPDDERQAAWREFRREGARARPLLRDARSARHALEEALTREPFNADDVHAAFEQVRQAEENLHERGHSLMIALLGQMSPEERAQFVRKMHERHDGHGRRRMRHGHDGPPRDGGGFRDNSPPDDGPFERSSERPDPNDPNDPDSPDER